LKIKMEERDDESSSDNQWWQRAKVNRGSKKNNNGEKNKGSDKDKDSEKDKEKDKSKVGYENYEGRSTPWAWARSVRGEEQTARVKVLLKESEAMLSAFGGANDEGSVIEGRCVDTIGLPCHHYVYSKEASLRTSRRGPGF
jgi:hypothetical protein